MTHACNGMTVARISRLLPWTLLAFVVGGSLSWIRRPGDFAGYLVVGELVLSGQDIYRDSPPGLNTWPPFFSLVCVALALLCRPTPYLGRAVWLALNFLMLWVALKILARLVHHTDLRVRPALATLSVASPEILIPLALCYRFVLGTFDHLQINIVIFACTLVGLYWHARGRDRLAGTVLGFAAALRVMPALFVPYLAYRRRYRVAAWAAMATAAFSLSPILVYGWRRFVEYVGAWRSALAVGWGVGKMNQSVYAMLDRYVGHGIRPWHAPVENVLPESGAPLVAIAMALVLASLTVIVCWLCRGRATADSPASIAEYSIIFIVSALFGPLAWKAYLVVLLCPCMLLVGLLHQGVLSVGERRTIIAALAIYFALSGLTTPGLLGKRWAGTLEMLSVTTLGTLVLLLVLLGLRPRLAPGGERG